MATKPKNPVAKVQQTSNPVSLVVAGNSIAAIASAPTPGAPSTPSGYVPETKKEVASLLKMTKTQASSAQAVAQEISSSQTFAADFGSDAGDPTVIVNGLTTAGGWVVEAASAARWSVYAKDQMHLAEDAAMQQMAPLAMEVQHAVAKHPELAGQYPALVAFVNARTTAAQKGAQTRKKKAKAGKKAQPAAEAAPAPAANAASTNH